MSLSNVFGIIAGLLVVASCAALLVAAKHPGHTCDLPCTVDGHGLAEDEVGFDFVHGGTVYVYRVTP